MLAILGQAARSVSVLLVLVVAVSACAPAAAPSPTPAAVPKEAPKPAAVAPTTAPKPAATPTPKPLTKVMIGTSGGKIMDYLPMFLAERKGFLAEEGLQVEIIAHTGSTEGRDVFLAGNTDLVILGLDSFVFVKEKGVDIRYALSFTEGMPWALAVAKGSGIKSVKDLKGKSIAISRPGSLTHGVARLAVEDAGLNPDNDVTYIGTGVGAPQVAALTAKKVDAAVLIDPFLSQVLLEGQVEVIYDYAEKMKGYGTAHLAVKKAFLDKNKEVVDALRRAYGKALAFVRTNKQGTYDIARQEFADTPEPVMKLAFDRMYPVYKPTVDYSREEYEVEGKLVVKFGFIKEVPFTYEEMAYLGK